MNSLGWGFRLERRSSLTPESHEDGAECVVKAQQAPLTRRSFLNLIRNSRTLRSGSQVIAMMQSTEPWYGDDCTARVCFPRVAARRSLLIQPKVSAIFVIVADVLVHQTLQMPLVQDDHMIEQITATVTNPALGNTVLPRASETGPPGLDTEALHSIDDLLIEVCSAIENQVSRSGIVGTGLTQLLNHPGAGRMPGHIEVQNAPSVMRNDKETI